MLLWPGLFQFVAFLSVFFKSLQLFFHIVHHFDLSVMLFLFQYLARKLFRFFSCLVFYSELCHLFPFQHPREFFVFHFLGQILIYAYKICSFNRILAFCTISRGSPYLTYAVVPVLVFLLCLLLSLTMWLFHIYQTSAHRHLLPYVNLYTQV